MQNWIVQYGNDLLVFVFAVGRSSAIAAIVAFVALCVVLHPLQKRWGVLQQQQRGQIDQKCYFE